MPVSEPPPAARVPSCLLTVGRRQRYARAEVPASGGASHLGLWRASSPPAAAVNGCAPEPAASGYGQPMHQLRLADLLAGLSLVTDLGMGLEPGEAGRAAVVAMGIADAVDAPDPRDVYYTALLQHVGCTAYAHEAAALLGGNE